MLWYVGSSYVKVPRLCVAELHLLSGAFSRFSGLGISAGRSCSQLAYFCNGLRQRFINVSHQPSVESERFDGRLTSLLHYLLT